MLWTKLGMGLLGMAGKGLAGSGLLQTLSQGLGSGKGGGSGKGMGCGRGGSLHGSGMKGSRSGKDGKGCRQTDAPALDELLTGLLQRQTTVGETVRTFLPAASPHEAGAETIDVQALPAGAAASTAVDNTDMEAAMRALGEYPPFQRRTCPPASPPVPGKQHVRGPAHAAVRGDRHPGRHIQRRHRLRAADL